MANTAPETPVIWATRRGYLHPRHDPLKKHDRTLAEAGDSYLLVSGVEMAAQP